LRQNDLADEQTSVRQFGPSATTPPAAENTIQAKQLIPEWHAQRAIDQKRMTEQIMRGAGRMLAHLDCPDRAGVI
jgi:hypothetical protein